MGNPKLSFTIGLTIFDFLIGIVSPVSAQKIKFEGERKIVSQTAVPYPKIASQMHLQGIVKIVATVAPSGKVVSTELIGGSPVFVPNALDAVTMMKWEPADKQTKEVIEIEFFPSPK